MHLLAFEPLGRVYEHGFTWFHCFTLFNGFFHGFTPSRRVRCADLAVSCPETFRETFTSTLRISQMCFFFNISLFFHSLCFSQRFERRDCQGFFVIISVIGYGVCRYYVLTSDLDLRGMT